MDIVSLNRHPAASENQHNDKKPLTRVMTYNIHSCIDRTRTVNPAIIAAIIQDLNPDIVALQEVDAPGPSRSNHHQAQIIAEKMGLGYTYFPIETGGLHAFGLAILSRYAIEESYGGRLPSLYPRLKPRKRGAIRANIQTPYGSINIINTHFSLFKLERWMQLKRLLGEDWLKAVPKNEPLIFCGDLNAGPLSGTYRTLSRYLTDVQKGLKKSRPFLSQRTFHSNSPLFRIDHIFTSRQFQTFDVKVVRTPNTEAASDHLPLVADLMLNSRK
jgi:endonuclease/exonuclease/phosphatase family metal-dependent hydrolase